MPRRRNPGHTVDLEKVLVVGISSRALFDLRFEDQLFKNEGLDAFRSWQQDHEQDVLQPGAGFPLVRALLEVNEVSETGRKVEVVVMSKNHPDVCMRMFHSIRHHRLDITRAALVGGADLAPYLKGFHVDLFLSMDHKSVQSAVNAGVPAALIYDPPEGYTAPLDEIRIAFDADAVVFGDESEEVYRQKGLEAFLAHEERHARTPLREGPLAKLFKSIAALQEEFGGDSPLRTAIVTSRNGPAHERVLHTLRDWNIRVDETFFLGGAPKEEILKAFGAHIFFDDKHRYVGPASKRVPSARVPTPIVQKTLFGQPAQPDPQPELEAAAGD